ncbi:MAG: tetratricopeptide repeat protein [Bdellovibrionales bacterium]|nr:tetratricopeptide repeat protein [Bdellovibrionales bacterium]
MNSKILLVFFLIPSVGACVTTREELNRRRESAAELDAKPVKTEELLKSNIPEKNPVEATASSPATAPVPSAQPPTAAPVPPAAKTDPTTLSEDELRAELARANGRLEEIQHEQELKERATNDDLKKAQERISALEKQLKELTPETLTLPEGKSPFDAGKDSFLAGKFDEAIVFLSQFLSKEEAGKQVEEATFLRGESHFKKLQYNKAILDYSKFPEKFQKSSFHPKALLRIAESFEATGRKDDAKVFYSDLVEKFSKTAEGKIAKKKLKK